MGGGKGDVERYVSVVVPGRLIFEVAGVQQETVIKAFANASSKLPFRTKIVSKEGL